MIVTDIWGWHETGFDPDKNDPSWRSFAIEACEFCLDPDPEDGTDARLAEIAEWWLTQLRKPGFISCTPQERRELAEVLIDFNDYEAMMGRDVPNVIFSPAIHVLTTQEPRW